MGVGGLGAMAGRGRPLNLKMKFVCGQCWREGQVNEPDKNLKYCTAKARHRWGLFLTLKAVTAIPHSVISAQISSCDRRSVLQFTYQRCLFVYVGHIIICLPYHSVIIVARAEHQGTKGNSLFVCLFSLFEFLSAPCLPSWTKERRVLLVKSFEKKKWVVVRPLPFSRTYPQQYDVSSSFIPYTRVHTVVSQKSGKGYNLIVLFVCLFVWRYEIIL